MNAFGSMVHSHTSELSIENECPQFSPFNSVSRIRNTSHGLESPSHGVGRIGLVIFHYMFDHENQQLCFTQVDVGSREGCDKAN